MTGVFNQTTEQCRPLVLQYLSPSGANESFDLSFFPQIIFRKKSPLPEFFGSTLSQGLMGRRHRLIYDSFDATTKQRIDFGGVSNA